MGENDATDPQSDAPEVPETSTAPNPASGARGVLRRFLTSLSGIEKILEANRSHLPSLSALNLIIDSVAEERGATLSREKHQELLKVMARHLKSWMDMDDEISERAQKGEGAAKLDKEYLEKSNAFWDQAYEGYVASGVGAPLALDLLLSSSPSAMLRQPRWLFYSSLLVSAVSMTEVFIGQMMRIFYRSYPQALHGTEVRFSFADISQFDSIESLRQHHVERQVEAIVRQGGLDEWMKWFDAKLKIGYGQVTTQAVQLREVFQRRHVHVHNDGDASDLYLAKMNDLPDKDKPYVGEHLFITEEYLTEAVDRLRLFGIALAVLSARKLTTKEDPRDQIEELERYSASLVYGLLRAGKYAQVIELVGLTKHGACVERSKLMLQVNSWIARSRLDKKGWREEVEQWDTSALEPMFELARLTLLENLNKAYDMAQQLLAKGDIDKEDYDQWPLLQPLRDAFPEDAALIDDGAANEETLTGESVDGVVIPSQAGPDESILLTPED
ncbi:hypothetical protein [Micromonospora sp. NPDC047187]|uniref:hypothetical protein n=1 Tax=Micromonospora sp. NPDC047187 TaxID=3155262 RepID=UPI00340659FF